MLRTQEGLLRTLRWDAEEHHEEEHLPVIFSDRESLSKTQLYSSSSFTHFSPATSFCPPLCSSSSSS